MTTSRLYGPLPLTPERIDKHLQGSSPGVFALGEQRNGNFVIMKIGRSDHDLRLTLKSHVGGQHALFMFRYALTPLDAFGKECELYQSLATLDNPIHPSPPSGTHAVCSRCSQHSLAANA